MMKYRSTYKPLKRHDRFDWGMFWLYVGATAIVSAIVSLGIGWFIVVILHTH